MLIELILSTSLFGNLNELIYRDLTDSMDTMLKTEQVNYSGQTINFQHQLWKVRNNSVCMNHEKYSTSYSSCTVAASEFFKNSCNQLTKTPSKARFGRQIQNMLCSASFNFKPTIVQISSNTKKSGNKKLESDCNALILKAMNNKSPAVIKERDLKCKEFNESE